jgi:hypothetical protein
MQNIAVVDRLYYRIFQKWKDLQKTLSTENTSILIIVDEIIYSSYLVAEISVLNTAIYFTISKKTMLQNLLV